MVEIGTCILFMAKIILGVQRKFSNLDVQKVMPFLDFCLRMKTRNEGATSNELNVLKVRLSTFKNSLTIMNQFGALKNTLAFQPKEFRILQNPFFEAL